MIDFQYDGSRILAVYDLKGIITLISKNDLVSALANISPH